MRKPRFSEANQVSHGGLRRATEVKQGFPFLLRVGCDYLFSEEKSENPGEFLMEGTEFFEG